MHQVSLKKICPLEAFQLHYCPDNDAKSMVKHFIFLQKFAVIMFRLSYSSFYRYRTAAIKQCVRTLKIYRLIEVQMLNSQTAISAMKLYMQKVLTMIILIYFR